MDRNTLLPIRIATALVAFCEAGAMLFAVVKISYAKSHGFTLVDALVAPVTLLLFAAPPLLLLGMANRARTAGATLLAAALVVVLGLGLEGMRALPWHMAYWNNHAEDASLTLFIGSAFGGWPLAVIGMLAWRRPNREPASASEPD